VSIQISTRILSAISRSSNFSRRTSDVQCVDAVRVRRLSSGRMYSCLAGACQTRVRNAERCWKGTEENTPLRIDLSTRVRCSIAANPLERVWSLVAVQHNPAIAPTRFLGSVRSVSVSLFFLPMRGRQQ